MNTGILIVFLDGRRLGIPTLKVREVVRLPALTRVPGAPAMIAGVINLRGQLMTAIDLRARLDLASRASRDAAMAVLVDHCDHCYALIVDGVGDVATASLDRQEPAPATLAPAWRSVTLAVQRDDALTLILDIDALLSAPAHVAAA